MAGRKSNAEWVKAFKSIDKDNSGHLDRAELEAVVKVVDPQKKKANIDALLEFFDGPKGDGKISLAEFEEGLANIQAVLIELKRHFDHFDKDKSGYLSKEELAEVLAAKSGKKLTPQQVNDIIAAADTNRDGKIGFEEFTTVYP